MTGRPLDFVLQAAVASDISDTIAKDEEYYNGTTPAPIYYLILERSRTALCRLIHATAKPSSSLNTAPIPDFLGPAAQNVATFSRARKKSWIRILPPEPALQTYTFWPIGVPQRRWLARYCSVPAFFCTDGTAASNVVMNAKKKWTRILCREPGSRLCPFTARPAR